MDISKTPFVILSPDGFEPKLTIAAMTDGEGARVGIVGKGSKYDVGSLLSELIMACLETGLSVDMIAAACAAGMRHAEARGIEFEGFSEDD